MHTGLPATQELSQDWLMVKEAIKEGHVLDSLLLRQGRAETPWKPGPVLQYPLQGPPPDSRPLGWMAAPWACPSLNPWSPEPAHQPPGQDAVPTTNTTGLCLPDREEGLRWNMSLAGRDHQRPDSGLTDSGG